MVWFKVDDKFWSHPKTLMTRLDAVGLWTITGSWCSEHLTDGRIPDALLWKISPEKPTRTRHLAAELVDSGLWLQDGGDWVFHQWLDHQPSRDRVEEERAAGRERRRRYQERKNQATVTPLRRVSNGVTNGVSNSDPTRPDPTRPITTSAGPSGPAGASSSSAGQPATEPAGTCPHGADTPRRCAICRKANQ